MQSKSIDMIRPISKRKRPCSPICVLLNHLLLLWNQHLSIHRAKLATYCYGVNDRDPTATYRVPSARVALCVHYHAPDIPTTRLYTCCSFYQHARPHPAYHSVSFQIPSSQSVLPSHCSWAHHPALFILQHFLSFEILLCLLPCLFPSSECKLYEDRALICLHFHITMPRISLNTSAGMWWVH